MIPTFNELIIPEAPTTIAKQLELMKAGLKPAVMTQSPIANYREFDLVPLADSGQWFYFQSKVPRRFYKVAIGTVLGYPTQEKPEGATRCFSLVDATCGLEILTLAYDDFCRYKVQDYLESLRSAVDYERLFVYEEPITTALQRRLLNWQEYIYSL